MFTLKSKDVIPCPGRLRLLGVSIHLICGGFRTTASEGLHSMLLEAWMIHYC
jgi:hypothetical protein